MMLPGNIKCFKSTSELNTALGAYVEKIATAAISARGRFVVATSGGSLPKNLGDALQLVVDGGKDLHTEKWHVFYVDERVVPVDHPDSNHAATAAVLYTKPWYKAPVSQQYPIKPELPAAECAVDYEGQIRALFGSSLAGSTPSFDLILLGMGPDGHTASLFPGHPLLTDNSRLIAEITDSPKPPPTRVTFTYRLINQSEHCAFVACGEGKAAVVKQIFDSAVPADESLPAARVRQAGGAQLPTWFMDVPACSQLPQ